MSFTEIIKESLLPLRASIVFYVLVTVFFQGNISGHTFLLTVVLFSVLLIIRIIRLSRIPSSRRTLGDKRTLNEQFSRNGNQFLFTMGLAPFVIWQFEISRKLAALEYNSSTTIQSITSLVSSLAGSSSLLFFFLFLHIASDTISGGNLSSLSPYDSDYSEEEIRNIIHQELEIREGERSHHS